MLFAGDGEGMGPTGLTLSAGLLVARAETPDLGRITYLAPMLLLSIDFFPPLLLYCFLIDEKCKHYWDPMGKHPHPR